ncbi:MAG: glycine-rich domain-containing protein [Sphingomonadaceae bacterium]
MSDSAVPVSYQTHPLWIALSSYTIGPDQAALSFGARLARENGWSAAYAERVMTEYKRFCFLAATAGHQVTPSDAVDQAWHLHLTYTRDYWERFCPEVLGRALHHGPTAGGAGEEHRFFDQYAQTLASYETAFGDTAPADLWPPAAQRLRDDPRARRVHPRDGVVISKLQLAAALVGVALLIGVSLLV